MKKLFLLIMLTGIFSYAENFSVKQPVIIAHGDSQPSVKFAAKELQKHLRLIVSMKISVRQELPGNHYPFYVGVKPPHQSDEILAKEEARWLCTPNGTWIWGEDHSPLKNIFHKENRTGTLFAVYDFLERQFGIRWLEPGDGGIIFKPMSELILISGEGKWIPELIQRHMRSGYGNLKYYHTNKNKIPEYFHLTDSEYLDRQQNINIWLKRQRMGNSTSFSYGHAFTQWWKLYGKEHPEYFAMQKDGVRRPEYPARPDRSKICVSNPGAHAQIIANWQQNPVEVINVCENDSGGYCRCPDCMKLDSPLPGENFGDHLTDRYVWFANTVLDKARKIDPNVSTVMYAYSCYRLPPRREKVSPGGIIAFVPSMLEIDRVGKMYTEWKNAGAVKLLLRPNDQHTNTGLPMGFEKQIFEHFQLGIKNGIIGTDYDTMHNYWPATGIADYILARAHIHPDRSFEYWENEYCSIYGEAGEAVKQYYRYWRHNIWEKRLTPNLPAIRERGRYGNFRRGLMWDINKYYRLEDFDKTDSILADAVSKVNGFEKKLLEKLQLANTHARLTFLAMTSFADNKLEAGKALFKFRKDNRDVLSFDWGTMMRLEKDFGDVSGIDMAGQFADYSECNLLPLIWFFQIDPQNIGEQQKWHEFSWKTIKSNWARLRVDRPWENQNIKTLSPKLKETLKNYDGIAYYAITCKIPESWRNNEISLYFGAVDESAWVYLNGQLAGQHIFAKDDDWKTPFAISITSRIDWDKPFQTIVVRVEDKAGSGGIWKPVYLVKK